MPRRSAPSLLPGRAGTELSATSFWRCRSKTDRLRVPRGLVPPLAGVLVLLLGASLENFLSPRTGSPAYAGAGT